ncbi:MAG TPA: hypothetical protein GXX40_10680 [Firmicutes bacterium]|nr:hypothetical protein [Bacillota bacterium]
MSGWRLLELGALAPVMTQAIYHSVAIHVGAGVSPPTLILCYPESPLVCVGYHEDAEEDVDVQAVRRKGYPLVRRMLGGGAVLLDPGQIFYQVIIAADDERAPVTIEGLFARYLEAPVRVYRRLGIPASRRGVNDIEVDGKKISGNGAGLIEGSQVLTGNIILSFPYDEMVQLLRVPDEKFRDKVARTLKGRLTTCRDVLGCEPDRATVLRYLVEEYSQTLEGLTPGNLSEEESETANSLCREYVTDEWVFSRSRKKRQIKLKVSERAWVGEGIHKAPGGIVRALLVVADGKIEEVSFDGDFFANPLDCIDKLSLSLRGVLCQPEHVRDAITRFLASNPVEVPGVGAEDFFRAVAASGLLTGGTKI